MTVKLKCHKSGKKIRVEMDAKKFGPLCVHKTWNEKKVWTVTHIATLYAVYRFFPSEKDAIAAAKRLQGLAWDFTTMAEAKRRKELANKVHAVLLKEVLR